MYKSTTYQIELALFLKQQQKRSMKYNQPTLDKFTDLLSQSGYTLRYERGSFQSGWCLLEARRMVVLNKFLDTEGRINTLLELIPQLTIEFDKLTHDSQKRYEELMANIVVHD